MNKMYASAFVMLSLLFTFKNAAAQNLNLQSSFDASAALSGSGNAGVVFIGTEYWISKFYTDSIYRLTPSGAVIEGFVIPGVTGVRGMTWDGTFIYAGLATTTISKINPVTKTQVGTVSAPGTVRHVSYSAAANGGAGGLWIGDSNTDIKLISLTGTVLQNIPYATHGVKAMYGSALDSASTNGGPYLWIFNQGTANSQASLARIRLSTGITDYNYNVLNDFPSMANGVAGGAFMSYSISPGRKTLIVLLSSAPNIVARYMDVTVLPVTFLSFTGERKQALNTLNWQTASEQNSKSFEVQRSADGKNFTTLATIASKGINGNSVAPLSYTLDDVKPIKGDNYYRLKQMDKNGNSTISQTIILKGAPVLAATLNTLYPNPVRSVINISLSMPRDGKINISITDIKGNLLMSQQAAAKSGSNLFALPAERLAVGNYILKAMTEDGQTIGSVPFVKQ